MNLATLMLWPESFCSASASSRTNDGVPAAMAWRLRAAYNAIFSNTAAWMGGWVHGETPRCVVRRGTVPHHHPAQGGLLKRWKFVKIHRRS